MSENLSRKDLCMGCMQRLQDSARPCSNCGWDNEKGENLPHQLPAGTMLNGKYLIGRALGQGGSGISYIGFDTMLLRCVAIKEYFPAGYCSRADARHSGEVLPFQGDKEQYYLENRSRYIEEARALARFDNLPGIVRVREYFEGNNTAYIILEYTDGINLLEYLGRKGGKLSVNEVFNMMQPLMSSLAQVHAARIIHRDISPENILIENPGRPKLIDFGSARSFVSGGEGVSIMLKPGYAPIEQYSQHGVQGPWTDIYALCATMYKLMTGVTPPDALARLQGKRLVPPSEMNIPIAPAYEQILMQGMAVDYNMRYNDIGTLYRALYMRPKAPPATADAKPSPVPPAPAALAPSDAAPDKVDTRGYMPEEPPPAPPAETAAPAQPAEAPASPGNKAPADKNDETNNMEDTGMAAKGKGISPFIWVVFGLGSFMALIGIAVIIFFAIYLL